VNDGWIKSKVYAQFLTDWTVFEDSDIDIDVSNGAVALNGSVKTTAAKARAVAIAKATDGVKAVKAQTPPRKSWRSFEAYSVARGFSSTISDSSVPR
jgi:osmotically-inducible protein OsmY